MVGSLFYPYSFVCLFYSPLESLFFFLILPYDTHIYSHVTLYNMAYLLCQVYTFFLLYLL
ncbi:hypothetical protein BC941DRAFT_446477, partial [Chlamydoabsidia padenii]